MSKTKKIKFKFHWKTQSFHLMWRTKNKIVFLGEIFNLEIHIGVTQNYQRWFSLSFFIQKNCKILGNKKFKKVNKEEMFVCQKCCGKYNFFWANCSFIESERENHLHQSFSKIDKSDSLIVALFYRATRANCSQSLFKMSNFGWNSEEIKS